jgi:hypothetical protein
MSDPRELYKELGKALSELRNVDFARAQGFMGGAKQVRLLRTAHARASSLKREELRDLGRLVSEYFSSRSQIALLLSSLYASLSQS